MSQPVKSEVIAIYKTHEKDTVAGAPHDARPAPPPGSREDLAKYNDLLQKLSLRK